jgi:hypothetical protein
MRDSGPKTNKDKVLVPKWIASLFERGFVSDWCPSGSGPRQNRTHGLV